MNHSLVTSCRDKERWIKKNITEFQVAWMYWRPWSKDWTIVVLCRSQSETLQSLLKHYILHDYINWNRGCPLFYFDWKRTMMYHCCLVASRRRGPWPLEFHWRSIQTMDVPALEMGRNQQVEWKVVSQRCVNPFLLVASCVPAEWWPMDSNSSCVQYLRWRWTGRVWLHWLCGTQGTRRLR